VLFAAGAGSVFEVRVFDDGDVWKVSVALGVVEAVADDEGVGNLEAAVVYLHLALAPLPLV
jgi:hypothetical protein